MKNYIKKAPLVIKVGMVVVAATIITDVVMRNWLGLMMILGATLLGFGVARALRR
jgi:predicted secreted protein